MYYFEILTGLFNKEIRYLIIGGLGVNLYGVPGVTQDLGDIAMLYKAKRFLEEEA